VHEVRCFCHRKPLLAVCGVDTDTGQAFIHVKSWKGGRLYTEMVVTAGTASIRCRECLRWHKLKITQAKVDVQQEKLPASIGV